MGADFQFAYKNDKQTEYATNLVASADLRRSYETTWRICRNFYAGRFLAPTSSNITNAAEPNALDRAAVNLIRPTIDTMYASSAISDPKYQCFGRGPDDQNAAVIATQLLNYYWRRYKFRDEFQLAAKDRLIIGHGWVKAVWDRQTTMESVAVDDIMEAYETTADRVGSDDPDLMDTVIEAAPNEIERLVAEYPLAPRVSPMDMYIDPAATHPANATWVAQRLWVPVAEVRANRSYNRRARYEVDGTQTLYDPSSATYGSNSEREVAAMRSRAQQGAAQRALLFEYHDLIEGTVATWAEGVDGWLAKPEESVYVFDAHRSPFEMIRGRELPGELYPLGEVEAVVSLQIELNEARTQQMRHRRKYARKFLVDENVLSEAMVESLTSTNVNEIVRVNAGNRPMSEIVQEMEGGTVPHELYAMSDIIMSDFQYVSGISGFARGIPDSTRRSATEAAALADVIDQRSAEVRTSIERAAVGLGERFLSMAQRFLTEKQVVRVANDVDDVSVQEWLSFTPAEIQGQFELTVEYQSMAPRDDLSRRNDLTALLSTLGQIMANDPRYDMGPVMDRLLAAYGLRGVGVATGGPAPPSEPLTGAEPPPAAAGGGPILEG